MKTLPLFLLAVAASATTITSTNTVSTKSATGQPCSQTGSGNVNCSSNAPGFGLVTASAYANLDEILAAVEIDAFCSRTALCVSVSGTASAQMDYLIEGPEGETGIIVLYRAAIPGGYGSASISISGLISSAPTPEGASPFHDSYRFAYNQPIHFSTFASLGCSECEMRSVAIIGIRGIYADVPEPATWLLCGLGFIAVLLHWSWRPKSS